MGEHNLHILSAEDDLDDQFIIEKALIESGIKAEIDFVTDGEGLIKKLTEYCMVKCPDLVLLDLNMPNINGFQVLKEIKYDDTIRDVPVVVLTTSSNQNHRSLCKMLGADSFITKPDSFDGFVSTIKGIRFGNKRVGP